MHPIKKGDTIALVSPASFTDLDIIDQGQELLASVGYKTKLFGVPRKANGRLSACDQVRKDSLHAAFADPEVKAILCTRGGYGSGRFASDVDLSIIRNNPKIFVGYSDITNLLCSFSIGSGLHGFHGPMLADLVKKRNDFTLNSFVSVLEGRKNEYRLDRSDYKLFRTGKGKGKFFGGNISILQTLAGVQDLRSDQPRVVFLEDVGEFMYQLDRSLVHLKRAGLFDNATAVIFADMNLKDRGKDNSLGYDLPEVIDYHLGQLDIPICYDIPAGHTPKQLTMPIGADCEVIVEDSSTTIRFSNYWQKEFLADVAA